MTLIAKRLPCRSCSQTVILARCYDGRWRPFETTWHAGDLYPDHQRWWLTKNRGMVNASMSTTQPERWLTQHFCETNITGMATLAEAIGGAS